MRTWVYRKPEPSHIQGTCVRCKLRKQTSQQKGTFRALCYKCTYEIYPNAGRKQKERNKIYQNTKRRKHYRKHVKDSCEKCGFIPEHICQLDVDHIDGNSSNNDISNLQTLCANCHRLKTFLNKDWINPI